jgi:biopolymer transport protein ExbD
MTRNGPADPDPRFFDMTPMIDVTFQLILFFMLSMSLSDAKTEPLRQPTARHALVGPPERGEVVVNVEADGRLRVSGKTCRDESLAALFAAQRRENGGDFPALIRADRSAAFERIQAVMTIAQEHGGVLRMRFGARKEESR